MPFTFSHPGIVLPLSLKRKLFSTSGLVAGSLAPDFEYLWLDIRIMFLTVYNVFKGEENAY